MRTRRRAFTLVELLVVIGIISVLIGILLPALNRARQQANLVSCASRLRQMGEALAIYESENKGVFPLAQFDSTDPNFAQGPQGTAAAPPPLSGGAYQWFWIYTLGQELVHTSILGPDNTVRYLPPIFADVDTIPKVANFSLYTQVYSSHYTCNVRVFNSPEFWNFNPSNANLSNGDPQTPEDTFKSALYVGRSVTDIKHPSNVFAIWDAPQAIDRGYNSYPTAVTIDAGAYYNNGLAFAYSRIPALRNTVTLPVEAGEMGSAAGKGLTNGAASQKTYNTDANNDFGGSYVGALRFRHMNNTKLNALCVDGHVENRLVGTVLRTDIYTNVPGTSN